MMDYRAQQQRVIDRVRQAHPEVAFDSFGGLVPVQGFGTWVPTGEAVYFRFRHDMATLEVGPGEDDAEGDRIPIFDQVRLYAEIDEVTGDEWCGDLTEDEAVELVGRLVALLSLREEWSATRRQRLMATLERVQEAHRQIGERDFS